MSRQGADPSSRSAKRASRRGGSSSRGRPAKRGSSDGSARRGGGGDSGPRGLGGEQVEGRRAVLELLRAGLRPVRSVWISASSERDETLDEIAELAGSRLRRVPAERLAAAAQSDSAQGVVARAAPLPEADVDELLSDPRAFLVALDGVTDPRNLGAVARCAETAGATGLLIPRHRSARFTPVALKAAAGAVEHLSVATVGGVPTLLDRASRARVWTVGLDETGDVAISELPIATEPLVLVLGAEGGGLSDLTRRRCEQVVSIPVHGHIASLNVAAAAAVACHEIARLRSQ